MLKDIYNQGKKMLREKTLGVRWKGSLHNDKASMKRINICPLGNQSVMEWMESSSLLHGWWWRASVLAITAKLSSSSDWMKVILFESGLAFASCLILILPLFQLWVFFLLISLLHSSTSYSPQLFITWILYDLTVACSYPHWFWGGGSLFFFLLIH